MDTKKLMKLLDEMMDELCGAESYAKCYLKLKESDNDVSRSYHNMAEDELKHAAFFYEHAKKEVLSLTEGNEILKEFLMSIWDEKDNHYLDCVTKIKMILAM